MEIIIGILIFCLVLFIYLHIQFHLKTGEDLEMYEIEQPSKDKLEEICDLRQPVIFDFDSQKIVETSNKTYISNNYQAFEVKIRNVKETDANVELYVPLPIHAAMKLFSEDKTATYISENNRDFLEETGVIKNLKYNDEFMRPYYDRIIPALREKGIIPIIDSDGDISVPAHWFSEAGLDGILPLERQAGVDIAALRAAHPTMRFIGHFDKMTMDKGEAAMRAEFERLLPTAARGGFLISCDHQTPPGVSYENYTIYLRLFREYAERAGGLLPS